MKTLQHYDKAGGQLFSGLDYVAKVLITRANKKRSFHYLKVERENFSLPSLQLNWNDLFLTWRMGYWRCLGRNLNIWVIKCQKIPLFSLLHFSGAYPNFLHCITTLCYYCNCRKFTSNHKTSNWKLETFLIEVRFGAENYLICQGRIKIVFKLTRCIKKILLFMRIGYDKGEEIMRLGHQTSHQPIDCVLSSMTFVEIYWRWKYWAGE